MRGGPAVDPSGGGASRVPCATAAARPTAAGMITAGATVVVVAVASLLLLVPTVFYLVPVPAGTDALTLCVPGIGPLHRFSDAMSPEDEELTYVHESVHAEQCRRFGAIWYAGQIITPRGRLTLEAHALCAEVALLAQRGEDGERLVAWTEQILAHQYLDGTGLPRSEVAATVRAVCGAAVGE